METVTFYGYKGGVGCTLLLAQTARILASTGHRIVALDLDLESPGLLHRLGDQDALRRAARGELRGAVDELLSPFEPEPTTRPLQQTVLAVDLPNGGDGGLFLIPTGSAPSPAYWASVERLNHRCQNQRRDAGLLESVLELQMRVLEEMAPDFLLVDTRLGITELGGLATTVMADRVICLTSTSPDSVEGIQTVAAAIRRIPRLSWQKPLRTEYLITRVPLELMESGQLSRIRQQLGEPVTVLPDDSNLATDDAKNAGSALESVTRGWIAESFSMLQKGSR